MSQQESTPYDLAYHGKTAAVKILLSENAKLKTQTDSVCIILMQTVIVYFVTSELFKVSLCTFLAEWSNAVALGGAGWSR